jgi:hypothetical protein
VLPKPAGNLLVDNTVLYARAVPAAPLGLLGRVTHRAARVVVSPGPYVVDTPSTGFIVSIDSDEKLLG